MRDVEAFIYLVAEVLCVWGGCAQDVEGETLLLEIQGGPVSLGDARLRQWHVHLEYRV